MTVRVAQNLGIDKIANFSKKMNIYKEPEKLLSISLGSAETTLLSLTSAYCSFVNGGKLINPVMIDRIQDGEGHTIINNENRKCIDCDKISFTSKEFPKIGDNYEQVLSPQTAYQLTSILQGVVKRGTGKKLKKLGLNLAGKTGTTNDNTDAWFIGFTSDIVIGVYVGMDSPQSLGKFETGSKAALPIFEEFVKKAVKKSDARPFKVPEDITLMVVDPNTGNKAKFSSKNTIIESYKSKNISRGEILYSNNNRLDTNNILRFY
jgi:penicillin-binding protein 1A